MNNRTKDEVVRMLKVVAALITEGGKLLICQRPENKARALMWEFPGGKVEAGEMPDEAIVREIKEELGADIRPLGEYVTVVHEYPDLCIELMVIRCGLAGELPRALEHREIRWITPEETGGFEFCGADRAVADKILKDGI